jgi:hypothetical protein
MDYENPWLIDKHGNPMEEIPENPDWQDWKVTTTGDYTKVSFKGNPSQEVIEFKDLTQDEKRNILNALDFGTLVVSNTRHKHYNNQYFIVQSLGEPPYPAFGVKKDDRDEPYPIVITNEEAVPRPLSGGLGKNKHSKKRRKTRKTRKTNKKKHSKRRSERKRSTRTKK